MLSIDHRRSIGRRLPIRIGASRRGNRSSNRTLWRRQAKHDQSVDLGDTRARGSNAARATFAVSGMGDSRTEPRLGIPQRIRGTNQSGAGPGRRLARLSVPLGRLIGPPQGCVFLAKSGVARYQVRAFSAPLLNAPHGPPQ
jgi:hypothetical protein